MAEAASAFGAEDAILEEVAALLCQEQAAKRQLLQRVQAAEKQVAEARASAALWERQRQASARSVADIKALREEVEHVRSAAAAEAELAEDKISQLECTNAA